MPVSTATNNELIIVLAEMTSNELGKRFMAAYETYVNELKEDCIQASPDTLQRAQGAARQAGVLLNMMRTSKVEVVKILQAEQAKLKRG